MRWSSLASIALSIGFIACGENSATDARKAEIASVMSAADESFIRMRPSLVAGKYARMASNPYDFYRGTVPLAWHDYRSNNYGFGASDFALDGPLAPVLGDPHIENFGILVGAGDILSVEPNDFDSADFAPYIWDVRRFVTAMALAAKLANADDEMAKSMTAAKSRVIARAAAEAYAHAIIAISRGEKRAVAMGGAGDPTLDDLFSRAEEDLAERTELADLTTMVDGRRALRRGILDPKDPASRHVDLPDWAIAKLPDTLARYRNTLIHPPEPAYFDLIDAARELGGGVASWARVRVVLLVRGPSDDPADDVVLELKELADSGIAGLRPPFAYYDDVGERIRSTSRAAWSTPDAEPLWGTSDWVGISCQIRRQSEAHKTIRVRRMVGEQGTPEALESLGRRLGELLAGAHAATPNGAPSAISSIAADIERDIAAFADEQADIAQSYSDQVILDHALFREIVDELGPSLGIPLDANDAPSADFAAILADHEASHLPPPPK